METKQTRRAATRFHRFNPPLKVFVFDQSAKIKQNINLKRQKYAGYDVYYARCLLLTQNTHELDIKFVHRNKRKRSKS